VKYSSMMTLHVSSQSASERNASHARAVKPTWHALCCSSNASNVHKQTLPLFHVNFQWQT